MNRLIAVFFAVVSAAAPRAAAEKTFNACSLLTRREIESVQGDRVTDAKPSAPERGGFAVAQCFYTLATFSKSISVEVTRRRPGRAEGPSEHWKLLFERALEKEKEGEERAEAVGGRERGEAARARPVEGVGDAAYWNGSSLGGGLYVLKGDSYFRVSLGGPLSETAKIERTKKLARFALRRLP